MEYEQKKRSGVSIRKLNYILAAITFLVSAVLLVVSQEMSHSYSVLRRATANSVKGQQYTHDLQVSSDYLTEQARSFTQTGEIVYLNRYFQESEQTRRRDRALEFLKEEFADTEAYAALESAMNESISLMQTEYYAMRLMAESVGFNISNLPEPVRSVVLFEEDAGLSLGEKATRARSLLYNDDYHAKKDVIEENAERCITELNRLVDEQHLKTEKRIGVLIRVQQVLIVVLVLIVLGIVALTTVQVIAPLINAIPQISDDKPIPVGGSSEFRFLASTYNRMYEENRERKDQLAYEACHDQLTAAYNRKGFEKIMNGNGLETATALLIDVDHFKGINDTYGHEAGDRLLARLTELLTVNFRASDPICRVGGDEFMLFLFQTGSESREAIREKIGRINEALKAGDKDVPPATISVGVVFGSGESGEELYQKADRALYFTKDNGRCGCAFFDEIEDTAEH